MHFNAPTASSQSAPVCIGIDPPAAAPAAGIEDAALGIYTKCPHTLPSEERPAFSLETYGAKTLTKSATASVVRLLTAHAALPAPIATRHLSPDGAARVVRSERYRLQSAARQALPMHRTAHCMYTSEAQCVGVHYSKTADRASYSNLITCGRVWTCPVCAAKISEGRRYELQSAVERAEAAGIAVYMITRTFPHTACDKLLDNRKKLKDAEDAYRNQTWYRIKKHFGIVATVRALEITLGRNGWHLHIHELVFVKGHLTNDLHAGPNAMNSKLPADFESFTQLTSLPKSLLGLRRAVFKHWLNTAIKSELLPPSWLNGVDISSAQGSRALSKYVNKWGLEHELTKATSKKSKTSGSLTPFDLLRVMSGTDDQGAFHIAKRFYAEYAEAMHGARQLVFAADKDYKHLFEAIEEDEALAEKESDDRELLALLSLEAWRHIRTHHRTKLLDAIEASPTRQTIEAYFAKHFPVFDLGLLFVDDI